MAAVTMAHRAPGLGKFIVCVALLQACAGSQKEAAMPVLNAAKLQLDWKDGLLVNAGKPISAILYVLQANGRDTSSIMCFLKGKEHGNWRKFHENGRLAETRDYDSGKKTGNLLAWWPNGQQQLAYQFKNGEFDGVCREWTDNGVLIKEMTYLDGHENGSQKQFYNDGTIKSNYVIISGRRYGLLGTKNCVNVSASVFKK